MTIVDLSEGDITPAPDGGALMTGGGTMRGRSKGASFGSSSGRTKRPPKKVRRGIHFLKPFMTIELWRACEMVTRQASSLEKDNFANINEYNICLSEWRARSYMEEGGQAKTQAIGSNLHKKEIRRKLEHHMMAIASSQPPQSSSHPENGITDSRLTRASRLTLSIIPSDGGEKGTINLGE